MCPSKYLAFVVAVSFSPLTKIWKGKKRENRDKYIAFLRTKGLQIFKSIFLKWSNGTPPMTIIESR